VAADLRAQGHPVTVLELDAIRKVLTPSPTYSTTEREVVYRALVFLAVLLTEQGRPVLVDATAHRRAWREMARARIPRFAEVQLSCPVEVCREREARRGPGNAPRGIYARAGAPGATVPGVDVPYEPAGAPELVVRTDMEEIAAAAGRVVALALRLGAGTGPPRGATEPGWAIWITGRPGSGKTTVARAVVQALGTRSASIRLLTPREVWREIRPDALEAADAQDMVHRTLACAAAVLTEAGIAVLLDAGAPRRAWRDLARALVPRFAEVELLCPPEVCQDRERAARWDLRFARPSHAESPVERGGLEDRFEFEVSGHAELVLRTHVQGVWTIVEEVLELIRRLSARRAASIHHAERRQSCE
jgi:adenylylsulfate kinase